MVGLNGRAGGGRGGGCAGNVDDGGKTRPPGCSKRQGGREKNRINTNRIKFSESMLGSIGTG